MPWRKGESALLRLHTLSAALSDQAQQQLCQPAHAGLLLGLVGSLEFSGQSRHRTRLPGLHRISRDRAVEDAEGFCFHCPVEGYPSRASHTPPSENAGLQGSGCEQLLWVRVPRKG